MIEEKKWNWGFTTLALIPICAYTLFLTWKIHKNMINLQTVTNIQHEEANLTFQKVKSNRLKG